jgi:hypothetical protein
MPPNCPSPRLGRWRFAEDPQDGAAQLAHRCLLALACARPIHAARSCVEMNGSSGVRHWPQRSYLRFRAMERRVSATLNRRVDRRVSVSAGSVLVVMGVGMTTDSVHPRIEFYSVVAQMLPILLLVAAVDGRYFRERGDAPPFDRFLVRGFWVVGLVGIGAALAVVARGHDSVILRGLVIYALVLVGVLVTVYAIHGPARFQSKAERTSGTVISDQSAKPPDD